MTPEQISHLRFMVQAALAPDVAACDDEQDMRAWIGVANPSAVLELIADLDAANEALATARKAEGEK